MLPSRCVLSLHFMYQSYMNALCSPHVDAVVAGKDGILSVLKSTKRSALLIDASTIDPAVSRSIAAQAKEIGSRFLDAPVSGGLPILFCLLHCE